jgi:type II secretory pathway pseudopilin PulG
MRKSLKIVAIAVVLFLAVSAVVLVYAGSQRSSKANDDEQSNNSMQNFMQNYMMSNMTIPPGQLKRMFKMPGYGPPMAERLLQNATLSTVNGTVVSEFNSMLILDTGATQVRILLPKAWTVGNEVIGRGNLFNGTFAGSGQSVTVNVLETQIFKNANFSLNIMIGYEAINATAIHAYAVLHFNIEPGS